MLPVRRTLGRYGLLGYYTPTSTPRVTHPNRMHCTMQALAPNTQANPMRRTLAQHGPLHTHYNALSKLSHPITHPTRMHCTVHSFSAIPCGPDS